MVFAHNDRMAAGAYDAVVKQHREHDMLFVGIDAFTGEGYGVEQVANRQLDATFIYPTGGDKVMEVAMNILQSRITRVKQCCRQHLSIRRMHALCKCRLHISVSSIIK